MAQHAPLSPSGAKRWRHCGASVRMSEGRESPSSSYSDEGELAHKAAQLAALGVPRTALKRGRGRTAGLPFTDEMVDAALEWKDHLEAWRKAAGTSELLVEVPVELRSDCYGTVDGLGVSEFSMLVADFKYGRGILVPVKEDEQITLYAGGALRMNRLGRHVQSITLAIYQPRRDGWKTEVLTRKELIERVQAILSDYDRTKDGDPVPGEWCRWCPALPVCDAARKHVTAVSDAGKDLLLDQLESRRLAELLDAIPAAEAIMNGWKQEAAARLKAGKVVPGWEYSGGMGNRKWKPTTTWEQLQELGYRGDPALPTVTAVQAAIKGSGTVPEAKAKVAPFVERLPTPPRLKRQKAQTQQEVTNL